MVDSGRQSRAVTRILATCAVVRPVTCLLAALSAGCGGYLASDPAPLAWDRGTLAMLGMAAVLGVANTVNDIVDCPADRVSKPGRPISSGRLAIPTAWTVVVALTTLAVTSAAALGPAELGFAVVLLVLAFAYSYRFKGSVLTGNLVVGVVCGGTLLFGSVAAGRLPLSSWVAAGVILLFVVGYEIVKTVQDRAADRAAGVRTLATAYPPGASVAAYLATAAALGVVALGAGPQVSSQPLRYLAAVVACVITPVYASAGILTSWPDPDRSAARSLLLMRLAWFPGLMSLTLLK